MDLEKAVSILKQDLKDNPEKLQIEKDVLEKYGKLFAYDNIDNITAKEFEDFCDFKNNRHWTISRLKTKLTEDMPKLRQSLKILLDETIPIASRLKRLRDPTNPNNQKYLGEAYFSPILLVSHPDKYPVYNGTVKDALDKMNLSKTSSRDIWNRYPEIITIVLGMAQSYDLSLWQMDSVWWKALGAKSFDELLDYIEDDKKMITKENFQPIVLRKILKSKSATKEEIENELDKNDDGSKTKYSINTVLDVLQRERNQMVRKDDKEYVINSFNELSGSQTEKLVNACNKRLEKFELDKNPIDATFKEAAIKILHEANEPLHYKEITKRAIQNNLIISKGQTPELTLLKSISEDIKINRDESIFKKTDTGVYTLNENDQTRFFIALGPWGNWEHTLNNPPFRWGVNPSSASNVGVFNALRPGDVVFYYANQDKPTPFSKRGLFGVGKVTRKYDEDSERYWPDEKLKDEIIYKHRFEIKSLKLVQSDSEMLPWIDGLPFTKGLNRIANPDKLKQLIDNTEKLWDIKLDSSETKYWKIAPGEAGEDWENQKSRGLIGIHFFDFDLTGLTEDELRDKISEKYGVVEVAKRANTFGQVRNFLSLKEGDIVVANSGKSKILGIGRVAGPYKFRKNEKYPHTFPVDWYDTTEGTIPKQEGWMATVSSLQKEEFEELTKLRIKYVLLRHSNSSDNHWRDDIGKKYHFGIAANYKKLIPGTKTIWFDRERGEDRYWGYGEVSRIEEQTENIFHAIFDHFDFFNDPKKLNPKTEDVIPKKGSQSTKEKIMSLSGWNVQNSILEITKDIYDEIVDGEEKPETFADKKLSLLTLDEIKTGYAKISDELLIPKEKITEIVTALASGRHVLLAGPIGTGKTRLAKMIPEIFWDKVGGYYSEDHTATADWSTQDVIGGIYPKMEEGKPVYDIQNGCVVDTVRKNWENGVNGGKRIALKDPQKNPPFKGTWLIIDEFNRADIDKAFGQLFTALRTRQLKIPTDTKGVSYKNLKIPEDYRIIGTLNTADKHFLFQLSDALKSRFAYIEVDIPKPDQQEKEIYYAMKNALDELDIDDFDKIVLDDKNKKINKEKSETDFYDRMMQAYYFLDTVRVFKKLGTAILKLIYQNLIVGIIMTEDSKTSLDNALTSNLIPQLENISITFVSAINSMHSDNLISHLKEAYKSPNRQSYVEAFEKILNYLQIKNKNLASDFANGNIKNDESWIQIQTAYDNKKKDFETGLDQIKQSMDDLIKSMVI